MKPGFETIILRPRPFKVEGQVSAFRPCYRFRVPTGRRALFEQEKTRFRAGKVVDRTLLDDHCYVDVY